MIEIGPVEKSIYEIRKRHPLVIPQFDPDRVDTSLFTERLRTIRELGIKHIAIGGTIVNTSGFQELINIAVKDFDISPIIYLTNSSVSLVKGVPGKTAVYWMNAINAENPFFSRDVMLMCSTHIKQNHFETIPTTYVFDHRDSVGTANWLARANPVPREKPEISLSIGLAAQYSGSRFYIMGGGSGSKLPPPASHAHLLAKKTNLFVIPTSGIRNPKDAKDMFEAGADAIHLGKSMEGESGSRILKSIVEVSKKYPGRTFI